MYKKITLEDVELDTRETNLLGALRVLDEDPEHMVIKYHNGHWHIRTDNYEAASDSIIDLMIEWLIENSF